MTRSPVFLSRSLMVLGCAAAILCSGAMSQSSGARSGPFANFRGDWSGTGIIRVKDQDNKQSTERIRCNAAYRQNGSNGVNLKLVCNSDNYNFDLTGDFEADENDHITGQWTEHTRNVGGGVMGQARGRQLIIHAESPALNANLSMATSSRSQSVSLAAAGGGQQVTASIRLQRR